MKIFKNRYVLIFLLSLFFLLITKIDYRFIEEIRCCQDDHDYFIHADTIAVDLDFDYSNQLEGFENKRFNHNGKVAPKGFVGTGIFSSPFLFIGNLLNNFQNSNIFNFKILFYSLSSVVYFFLSILLIYKTLNDLKIKSNIFYISLLMLGSGLPYFAFERYSMSHIYEVFSITCILYLSNKFLSTSENKYAFLIPIAIVLSLSVRWVNYYVIFLPFVMKLMFYKNEKSLKENFKNKYYLLAIPISLILFSVLSKAIYGIFTFNPQFVYGTSGMMTNFLSSETNLVEYILLNIKNLLLIFYTQEFGIIWFSPIIFIGTLLAFYLLTFNRENMLLNILILFSYLQNFAIVLIWKSTASSYGFRYLFNLVPLSIFVYYHFKNTKKSKLIDYYLITFSIIGILSLLFFETTEMTQLSLVDEVNTFGRSLRFTEPNYLRGFIYSFLELNSYLKIFTTSFLGAVIFKSILLLVDKNQFISILSSYGLPVQNDDFVVYLDQIQEIEFYKFVKVIFVIYFFVKKIVDEYIS